ncbi:MAG: hypothetical protein H7237_11745 [Alkalinema sp. FL-bin-369]|nr:hypothetical protein [Leptolyngbyaceae cyanobacterium LF-bin-369]
MSSIANEQPAFIQNRFTNNGDNTQTVRFENGAVWDYVTVDRFLPQFGRVRSIGRLLRKGGGGSE